VPDATTLATPLVPATKEAEALPLLEAADEAGVVADPDPVAAAVPLAAGVEVDWPVAHEAAVGRFVTPAGTQMLSAYLRVAASTRFFRVSDLSFLFIDIITTKLYAVFFLVSFPSNAGIWVGDMCIPSWSAVSQTAATQHVMALMKPASEQMHFGSRLHELGIALMVQFC
jgi:hypothetical protein